MALKIVTADERLATRQKINVAVFGPSGVGKTTQAKTLDPKTTLFLDGEAGTLAIQGWAGDVIDLRSEAQRIGAHPWELARGLACWIGGPDPAAPPTDLNEPYSKACYDRYCEAFGDPKTLAKYETIFVDSITVVSRWSHEWAGRQPEAFSDKTGKPDPRGAYGLHGRQMVKWLTHLQHIRDKNIVVVGILDAVKDDFGRTVHEPQIVGSMAGLALPGIFDEVLTLQNFKTEDGALYRAFVCHQQNQWGYPAKDRSGCLDLQEPPDLGALMHKIAQGKRNANLITTK